MVGWYFDLFVVSSSGSKSLEVQNIEHFNLFVLNNRKLHGRQCLGMGSFYTDQKTAPEQTLYSENVKFLGIDLNFSKIC